MINFAPRLYIIWMCGLLFVAISSSAMAAGSGEQTIRVVLPQLPNYSFGSSSLDFYGNISVSEDSTNAHIWISRIFNSSYTNTSGSLRIELWAVSTPVTKSTTTITGHVMASIRTNQISGGSDTLTPRAVMDSTQLTLPYTSGTPSEIYQVLFLEEYQANPSCDGGFCVVAFLPADMLFRDGFGDYASP
ncbi:MAG: hypothetical protein JSR27_12400 [Proteobacteria bacterium]|nr:hypothetical protein [Pseudomonadota bacterium]